MIKNKNLWCMVLLILPGAMGLMSCSKKFDPLFNLYTNDFFEQPSPDGTVLVFKDTNKFDYTVNVNLAEAARLHDSLTSSGGVTLLMRRPDWRALDEVPAGFRNDFLALTDRWSFKYLAADKPTSLTLIAEDHFLREIRALRPLYETRWHITRFRKGNGPLRFFVGYGISPVKVKLEGEVLTPEGARLAKFTVMCKEAGMTMGGWNYRVMSWKYCAKVMTPILGKGLSEVFAAATGDPYLEFQTLYDDDE